MAHKCVCDICGADASPAEYTVPFIDVYYAEQDGVKIQEFEKFVTKNVNFCGRHYREVARILKVIQNYHIKT